MEIIPELETSASEARVDQLQKNGYDVLIVTMPNGASAVYKRPSLNQQKGSLFHI